MTNKTVLITGSNRGLGLAFAKYYTNAGWNVIATTRRGSNAQHLKALSPFKTLTIDVQDESTVLRAAEQLKGIPIDLLINNAGIFTGGDTMDSTLKNDMMKEFEVHAVGPLLVTRALLPNLKLGAKAGNKCAFVVQMSTIYASIESGGGPYAYCTSKTALHMVNHLMANELKRDNIASVLLDPGMVYTNMPLSSYETEAAQVVAGMASVIDKATLKDTGKLMDYNGTVLPW
ncbi:putative short chain dehydrogenase [Phytophthora cinnamomi]|uniref:putative short chain dehydrogenase n=1 Tax=Phytophthora cinnamomi TaxID=4785 RepID=UPI002A344A59|nr:putative short chain dehydrogenase [Phytophthora cinnamomi]KAJ8571592.1 hypothetical protein ON010_g5242 [Phytophthora cinnamomi]